MTSPGQTRAPEPSAAVGAWRGGAISPRAACVLAPNPGPMTLDGTNTWVLAEPGGGEAIVIDPGPNDPGHLAAGALVTVRGLEVRVEATPGHTADSISLVLAADNALLTGDTVLGRGTTVVAHPDGELSAYLETLDRLRALTGSGEVVRIWPGHGPVIPDAAALRTMASEKEVK